MAYLCSLSFAQERQVGHVSPQRPGAEKAHSGTPSRRCALASLETRVGAATHDGAQGLRVLERTLGQPRTAALRTRMSIEISCRSSSAVNALMLVKLARLHSMTTSEPALMFLAVNTSLRGTHVPSEPGSYCLPPGLPRGPRKRRTGRAGSCPAGAPGTKTPTGPDIHLKREARGDTFLYNNCTATKMCRCEKRAGWGDRAAQEAQHKFPLAVPRLSQQRCFQPLTSSFRPHARRPPSSAPP